MDFNSAIKLVIRVNNDADNLVYLFFISNNSSMFAWKLCLTTTFPGLYKNVVI